MLDFNDPQEILGATLDGRFRLTRVIGQGGLGVVFEADALDGSGKRAVKMLRPEFAESPEILDRFLDEIMPSVRIDHPGVARVYEAVRAADGTPYLVMELLIGQPLSSRMNRGRVPAPQAAAIVKNMLEALAVAHAAGVVHRDLKPGNIFMVGDVIDGSDVKLLDFGIALVVDAAGGMQRKTRTGMMLGTPGYMSPEQIRSIKQADARADLWSVGIIFYEMLTGAPAFDAENEFAKVTKVLTSEPRPIEQIAPQYAHWSPFFARALAKSPEQRFQSAREMAHAVDSVASHGRMPDAVPPDTRQSMAAAVAAPGGSLAPVSPVQASQPYAHHPSLPPQPSVPPYSNAPAYPSAAPGSLVAHSTPEAGPRRFGGDTAVSAGLAGAPTPAPGSGSAVQVVNVPKRTKGLPIPLVLIIVAIALAAGFALGVLVGRW